MTAAAAALVLVGGGAWFVTSARARRETFAARALRDAQAAVGAGNVPLAVNDLGRLVQTYRGTNAAHEAAILLAQLRLSRAEPDSAISGLQSFIQSDPPRLYKASAYDLLGAALEQTSRASEAAEAYRRAAEEWEYDYLKAQALLDAGRAFRAAGDTTQAVASYERVLRDFASSPSVPEAKLRLGELRRGALPIS